MFFELRIQMSPASQPPNEVPVLLFGRHEDRMPHWKFSLGRVVAQKRLAS